MITQSDNSHSRKIQVYLIVAIGPVKIALKDKIVIFVDTIVICLRVTWTSFV